MHKLISVLLVSILLNACSKPHTEKQSCPLQSSEMQETNYDGLSDEYKKLLDAAELVMKNSYNPYSKFAVGAALLAQDGTIISGSNFENAAYGSSVCAERAAILRANAMGYRNFKAIAIIAHGEKDVEAVVAPCGACRQVIYEVSELSDQVIDVIMSNTRKDHVTISTIEQLLPLAFGPKALGVDLKAYRH